MKKLTLLAILAALIFGGKAYSQDSIKQEVLRDLEKTRVFKYDKNEDYESLLSGNVFIDDSDIPKGISRIQYDFSGFWGTELEADFKIKEIRNGKKYIKNEAVRVAVDTDGDGSLETVYSDGDGDGYLETKVVKSLSQLNNEFKNKLLEELNNKRIFYESDYSEFYMNNAFMKENLMIAGYDLNKNGKMDIQAEYPTYIDKTGELKFNFYASRVLIDKNEDGTPEICYIDEDRDGKLEKKLTQ